MAGGVENDPRGFVSSVEALSAIAYAQLERPGAKMILGSFLAAVSMKSGAPMAGTGELGLMNLMIGQLARRYKLPWRSSGMLTGSKVTDAQAGYESAFNMFPIMLAGANYVMHCAGWTEAGLTASFAKFMLDAEQMEMLWKFGHGPRFEDFDEAVATIGQVGPGGHFLGTAHTQAHFQDAFFMSDLFDNNSFEQWLADGAKEADARGLEAARRALDGYVAPALDPGVEAALADFIASLLPKNFDGIHPATRAFQAIRIAVNDELGAVERHLALPESVRRRFSHRRPAARPRARRRRAAGGRRGPRGRRSCR